MNIHYHYQLSISNLRGADGELLDGTGDGQPGGTFTTIVTKNNFPFPLPPPPKPNASLLARWARRYPRLAARWTLTHTPGE